MHADRHSNSVLTVAMQGDVGFTVTREAGLWKTRNEIASHVGITKLQSLSATGIYRFVDVKEKKSVFRLGFFSGRSNFFFFFKPESNEFVQNYSLRKTEFEKMVLVFKL